MDVELIQGILIIVAMLILSAFFSGLEIAFISVNKLRVELKSNQGKQWAKMCSSYLKQPSKFISTILVGNNISLVIYGVTMEQTFQFVLNRIGVNIPGYLSVILATVLSTLIVLFLAEFLPKALFRINPSAMLSLLIYPFQLFYVLLWPFVQFVIWLSKKILNATLRIDFTEKSPEFTKVDLDHFISQSAQHAEGDDESDIDTDMLKNALDFGSVKVRDCLVPRTEIVAVDKNLEIKDLVQVFIDSQHSKILVYEENIDNIIGYVHHIDLQRRPASIESILIPILITNEARLAKDLLNEFSKTQKSIALVVDEYGGTAGIVTIEDVMEEIFGEIEDEHDEPDEEDVMEAGNGVFVVDARAEVDMLNERYDLGIPEGEYESIGGFVVSSLENIPETGDSFVIENFEIKILEATDNRIVKLQIQLAD